MLVCAGVFLSPQLSLGALPTGQWDINANGSQGTLAVTSFNNSGS
jgi:hypothetical protein